MNEKLIDMLKLHEGYRLKPYRCSEGKLTIGVGHNIDANPLPPEISAYLKKYGQITDEMAMWLLEKDIQTAILDCQRIFPGFNNLSQNRRNALTDMMFNMGIKTFLGFTQTIAHINLGQWDEVARHIKSSRYYRQLGGDPDGKDDGKIERPETICRMLIDG